MLSDELELGLGDEFGWMYTEGIAPTPPGGFGLFSDILPLLNGTNVSCMWRCGVLYLFCPALYSPRNQFIAQKVFYCICRGLSIN